MKGNDDSGIYMSEKAVLTRKKSCINCSVNDYCGCERADELFNVETIMKLKLSDICEGIKISDPIKPNWKLRRGEVSFASLSPHGILAICSDDEGYGIEFTNLNINKQVIIEVEDNTNIGFYDDNVILLTWQRPLRECKINKLFNEPSISAFTHIGTVEYICPEADTSIINSTRVLYYTSALFLPFAFNVDTRINEELYAGRNVYWLASFTGINCGVKFIFQSNDNNTYTYKQDCSVSHIRSKMIDAPLTAILPCATDSLNVEKAVHKHGCYLVTGDKVTLPRKPITLGDGYSIIRVYRDVFLVYDLNIFDWILCRIIIV